MTMGHKTNGKTVTGLADFQVPPHSGRFPWNGNYFSSFLPTARAVSVLWPFVIGPRQVKPPWGRRHQGFRRLLCGLTLLACAPALAGDPVTVTISQKDCRRLALHTPAPDVAYKGGVDARGKKVAPADIGGQKPLRLPDVLQFEVERELVDLPGETTGDLQAGTVRYNINSGRLTYNG